MKKEKHFFKLSNILVICSWISFFGGLLVENSVLSILLQTIHQDRVLRP